MARPIHGHLLLDFRGCRWREVVVGSCVALSNKYCDVCPDAAIMRSPFLCVTSFGGCEWAASGNLASCLDHKGEEMPVGS